MNMNSNNSEGPIGVFDSGIGGLTVMAALMRQIPEKSIIYLGDNARVPYGTKSAETIVRYSLECAHFLVERGISTLVVACNTASAYALPALSREFSIPVIGVIEPGAQAAINKSSNRCIGVIGTNGTISSNAYGQALKRLCPSARIVSTACPLFVPLVEEGWCEGPVVDAIAQKYLGTMNVEGIDTLILGCTHYPLLHKSISHCMGSNVSLIDSAEATANMLKVKLQENQPSKSKKAAEHIIYVTDMPSRFEQVAGRFLGERLPPVRRVDL